MLQRQQIAVQDRGRSIGTVLAQPPGLRPFYSYPLVPSDGTQGAKAGQRDKSQIEGLGYSNFVKEDRSCSKGGVAEVRKESALIRLKSSRHSQPRRLNNQCRAFFRLQYTQPCFHFPCSFPTCFTSAFICHSFLFVAVGPYLTEVSQSPLSKEVYMDPLHLTEHKHRAAE